MAREAIWIPSTRRLYGRSFASSSAAELEDSLAASETPAAVSSRPGSQLLLNNPHLGSWSRQLAAVRGESYDQTLKEFKGLVAELTFAAKSFFFLVLGYLTDLDTMRSWRAWAIAVAVFGVVFVSRYAILRLLRQRDKRILTWIAPRGLITVLLFLAVLETGKIPGFPLGAVMLVVLATSAATALAHRGARTAAAPIPDTAVAAKTD